jgi:DNA-binding transcriptional LysR family regulator
MLAILAVIINTELMTTLNLRQIEVFRAVMTTGSIKGASLLLHVSPPAVSRLLSHTELRLGFALFERIKGRLYPTPEARHLMQEVESVYLGVQRVGDLASEIAERRYGLLHLACSPSIGHSLAAQVLARFRAQHPDIRVKFRVLLHQQMKEQLLDRKSDVAISILPMDHPNLQVTPVASGSMICVCRPDHALARKSQVSLPELRPYPLICYGRDTPLGQRAEEMFANADEPLKPAIEVDSAQSACALVSLGAGVGIIHEFSLRDGFQEGLTRIRIADAPSMVASLVHPRYEPLSQAAQAFVATLREEISRQETRQERA